MKKVAVVATLLLHAAICAAFTKNYITVLSYVAANAPDAQGLGLIAAQALGGCVLLAGQLAALVLVIRNMAHRGRITLAVLAIGACLLAGPGVQITFFPARGQDGYLIIVGVFALLLAAWSFGASYLALRLESPEE